MPVVRRSFLERSSFVLTIFCHFCSWLFCKHEIEAFSISSNIDTKNIKAAVIVPGFLTGADEFQPLIDSLKQEGIPAVAVPFPNWHWIPCLGGRSVRPILDRIDYTVKYVCANHDNLETNPTISIPKGSLEYNFLDCFLDFLDNPGGVGEVGGSAKVDEYPKNISPRGNFVKNIPLLEEKAKGKGGKIALIGHSAGGWISRIYLSNRDYGGKVYGGAEFIHSLVTLGSPHGKYVGGSAAFESVNWIYEEDVPVRSLAVAGKGFVGEEAGQFTVNAYAFCGEPNPTKVDGDGVTPVNSALDMKGSTHLLLDGTVTHFPWSDIWGGSFFAPDLAKQHEEQRTPWYGTNHIVTQWASWLFPDD